MSTGNELPNCCFESGSNFVPLNRSHYVAKKELSLKSTYQLVDLCEANEQTVLSSHPKRTIFEFLSSSIYCVSFCCWSNFHLHCAIVKFQEGKIWEKLSWQTSRSNSPFICHIFEVGKGARVRTKIYYPVSGSPAKNVNTRKPPTNH